MGLHFSAFFESLRHTSIASAVILSDAEVLFVALGSFVALLSVLLLKKKLSVGAWLSILLAFAGAVVVALADGGGESGLWGNALALTSTFLLAMYTLIGASVRSRISNTTYTFVAYFFAALTVLVISLISGTPLTGYGANNLLTALGMAVLCTLMGHSIFTWGLKYLPPAYISTVKLLDPVFSALWGLLLFNEKPTLLVILGVLLVRLIMKIVTKTLEKTKLEKAAHSLILSVVNVALYIILGLIIATKLGIDVTSIVALASVLTLAVSLALQNMLANVIGGFTLLYTHPFGSGDYVEIAGQSGTGSGNTGKQITFCSTDKNCDGLVDALSPILMPNITAVSATEFPEGTSSHMCWTADSDYLQHRITPGISRYLGMGTEISFTALKNNVERRVTRPYPQQ